MLGDGGGDIVARLEVTGADDVVGKGAVHENFGATLDERLDLGLPLFGPDKAWGGQQGQDFLRTRGVAEEAVKRTTGGDAFTAFAGEDESSMLLEDARASGHAFDTLVKVEVERVARVGGDDDVEGRFDALHRGLADELVAGLVSLEEIAREDPGQLALFVQGDVQEETGADAQGDVSEFFPERVAHRDAKGGARIADVPRAVVAHDRLKRGAARHDALGSATEAGKEVRFNETGDDTEVGLDEVAVDEGGRAVTGGAELDQGGGVFGFMIDDPVGVDDLRGQQATEFGVGVGSVCAELIEERNAVAGMSVEMLKQPGDDPVVGGGARQVGERDADPVGGLDELAQGKRADGVVEGVKDGLAFIRQTRLMGRGDDGGAVIREFDRELTLAVGEQDFHGDLMRHDSTGTIDARA